MNDIQLGTVEALFADIIWANDVYEDAVKTYRHNLGEHIGCEDIA